MFLMNIIGGIVLSLFAFLVFISNYSYSVGDAIYPQIHSMLINVANMEREKSEKDKKDLILTYELNVPSDLFYEKPSRIKISFYRMKDDNNNTNRIRFYADINEMKKQIKRGKWVFEHEIEKIANNSIVRDTKCIEYGHIKNKKVCLKKELYFVGRLSVVEDQKDKYIVFDTIKP